MNESYFWIRSGENGIDIHELTKEEVEKVLAEETNKDVKAEWRPTFLSGVPQCDRGHFYNTPFNNPVLLVKGRIVVPTSATGRRVEVFAGDANLVARSPSGGRRARAFEGH